MAANVPEPVVMGVVNVTPDSFSDGGEWLDAEAAIAHGHDLVAQGAAILDIGGESTRPGAEPVSEAEELRRVVPVLTGLAGAGARLSIDTSKAAVAAAALDAGATLVNDVTALRGDPDMAALVAERGCDVCLMHMLGEPRTMQRDPRYVDVVAEVAAFLEQRLEHAVRHGIAAERVWLDPGIGFGKTIDHNLDGKGNGFNVPSLLGIEAVPPYMHNGACETLACVVADPKHRTANGTRPDAAATARAQAMIVAYLRSIDAGTPPLTATP